MSTNHDKHEALKHWFQDLTKQAHIHGYISSIQTLLVTLAKITHSCTQMGEVRLKNQGIQTSHQREVDKLVVKDHDDLYDLNRISDRRTGQSKLADPPIFQLVPRTQLLRISSVALVYLAKQRFGKSQRKYIHKFCPNLERSTRSYLLDSRDLHLRTCRMNNVNQPRQARGAETLVPRPYKTGTHPLHRHHSDGRSALKEPRNSDNKPTADVLLEAFVWQHVEIQT